MFKNINTNASYRTEGIVLPTHESKETIYAPQEIVEYLNRNVIGQEQAKKTLALAVYNHMQRINHRQRQNYIPKSNILLQGSTGSGKTFILKNLAKLIFVMHQALPKQDTRVEMRRQFWKICIMLQIRISIWHRMVLYIWMSSTS